MIVSKDGTKRHTWANRVDETVIDCEVDEKAAFFIGGCNHLTPAREQELDVLIGIGSNETEGKPDKDILDALSEWDNDWTEKEPTPADLRAIAGY